MVSICPNSMNTSILLSKAAKGEIFAKSTFVFICLLFLSHHAKPQPNIFCSHIISMKDGLEGQITNAVLKDSKGGLWICNSYGLNHYDGYYFTFYPLDVLTFSNPNFVKKIQEDQEGNLWIFLHHPSNSLDSLNKRQTQNIFIFSPKTGKAVRFESYFRDKVPFNLGFRDFYSPAIIDPLNRIWICTANGELFQYQHEFKKVFHREGASIRALTCDRNNNLYLTTEWSLISIDSSGKVVDEIGLPHKSFHKVVLDHQGSLWFITKDFVSSPPKIWVKRKDKDWAPFSFTKDGLPFDLSKHPVNRLYKSPKGYWILNSESPRDLLLFDENGRYMHDYLPSLKLHGPIEILSIFEEEDFWLATSHGVIKLSVEENPFRLIHHFPGKLSKCRGITEDENGNILFLDHHLYQWNPNTNQKKRLSKDSGTHLLFKKDSLIYNSVYGPNILIETNESTLKSKSYNFIENNQYLAISQIQTQNPYIHLIGCGKGLLYFDTEKKEIIPFEKYNGFEAIKDAQITFIHRNNYGIWLSSSEGLFLMKEEEGIVRQFNMASGDLPVNYINHIHEDKDGVFWMATRGGGIIKWEVNPTANYSSTYMQFTTSNGLSNNYTYAIYEDKNENLWIPSNYGLVWMDKKSFQVRSFIREDGLPNDEFNFTSHYQGKDGSLYFGGLGGLISFHPKHFEDKLIYDAPLKFSKLMLLEQGKNTETDLTQLLASEKKIRLKPDDRFYTFHFLLADLDKKERHSYAYKIEGFSENWQLTEENYLRINSLPYGEYSLKIRGRHKKKGWSTQMLEVKLQVLKPFYMRVWFISICILTIFLSALFISYQWSKRHIRAKKRLEAEVRKRTQKIEEDKKMIARQAAAIKRLDESKTRFFTNITHEFRTPLSLIIGPLEQISTQKLPPLAIKKKIDLIIKNAQKLLRLINQLLDLAKLESGQMKIEVASGNIVRLTKELVDRFQPLALKKEQLLEFICPLDTWKTHFDKDKWEKIIYNLLSNAIKYSPNGNPIQLHLDKIQHSDGELILLKVVDNGVGMSPAQIEHIFERFYQNPNTYENDYGGTGIGLALVKELVELQDGKIEVISKPQLGSTFKVSIPIRIPFAGNSQPEKPQSDFVCDAPYQLSSDTASLYPKKDSGSKLKLLIVEDNEEMRQFIRDCLNPKVYHIIEAKDGEEGIDLALGIVPDLIITDVMMPQVNGFILVETIRKHISTSHIPIIMLSAKTSMDDRMKGFHRGVDIYLTKPFSPRELSIRVDNLIEIRNRLQNRYVQSSRLVYLKEYQAEDKFITQIKDFIVQNLNEHQLNGDIIGDEVGLSRVHLHRKIKALTNLSTSEFIKKIRLEQATKLLKTGQFNVSEVAYEAGFSSPSQFSKDFKKAFGKAPSKIENN